MNAEFFTGNRRRLRDLVKKEPIILAGHIGQQRMADSTFAFEQEANFWYLTGIEEPGWKLIIVDKAYLIAPKVDAIRQVFDGSLAADEAQNISGVDKVLDARAGKKLIDELAAENRNVWTVGVDSVANSYDFGLNPGPVKSLTSLKRKFTKVEDCQPILNKLRAIKQPQEIEAMREAIALTAGAFEIVKNNQNGYQYEYQVEADFTNIFRGNGAKGHAYEPIVASGKNACTLHYIKNNAPLEKGLLLIDIGARHHGYAADITRTYGIGEVTDRQKEVHAAVQIGQKEIIELLRPGLSVKTYHEKVDEIMQRHIKALGLLKTPADYRRYFPHAVSHGLGIDVHDPLGLPKTFEPGMVLTVEPGIYIPEEGIGVRIEDDILITETGYENLSAALPTGL